MIYCEGRYFAPSKTTWAAFREAFEAERLPSLAPNTAICYDGTFNRVQLLLKPNRLTDGVRDHGAVFEPELVSGVAPIEKANWVSKIGSRIGAMAGVVVKGHVPIETGRKYASLHDLRRSFGERWSRRVMPQVLMALMRHESIETTMRFYVGQDADRIAVKLWKLVESSATK